VLLGIINNIFGNLNQVMIGKYFTAATVGFFSQGKMFKDNVTSILNDTVMNVTFPMLAKLQDDKIRLKNAYKRIVRMNSFTIFPAITILILSAEPLIVGLLGEKWRGSVVFLKILGISGYVMHLHSINLNVLKVCGKGKDYLHQGFFRNGLMLVGVLVTINISVIAMAWAFVVGEFLQLFINVYYSNKYIKFTIKEQFEIMLPLILITFVMGICVYIVGLYNFPWLLMKLVVMAISGVIIYLGLSIYFKIDAFADFKDLMLKKIYNK
jgi:O-antigen/teichoic acid export membrane protein